MNKFQDSSIFFIGDSITEAGGYIKYLRAHFSATQKNIFLHNKGVPGGRMDMIKYYIDEDFASFKPKYAVIVLGVNDLRIMLYDGARQVTDNLLQERQSFIDGYQASCREIINKLKETGVTPILCSPFCANEHIIEKGDIQTVVDNQDKKDIRETFYTKKTFRAINEGLRQLSEVAKNVATQTKVEFWDLFTQTLACASNDNFTEDGIHYSEKGHFEIAKIMLNKMIGEDITLSPSNQNLDQIARLEFEERSYYFIKHIVLHERLKSLNHNYDLIEETTNWIAQNGNVDGVSKERELAFFRYATNPLNNQKNLIDKILCTKI